MENKMALNVQYIFNGREPDECTTCGARYMGAGSHLAVTMLCPNGVELEKEIVCICHSRATGGPDNLRERILCHVERLRSLADTWESLAAAEINAPTPSRVSLGKAFPVDEPQDSVIPF